MYRTLVAMSPILRVSIQMFCVIAFLESEEVAHLQWSVVEDLQGRIKGRGHIAGSIVGGTLLGALLGPHIVGALHCSGPPMGHLSSWMKVGMVVPRRSTSTRLPTA